MRRAEPSLERQLTLSIVLLAGTSLLCLALAVQSAFTKALWRQFDARLEQDAAAIALMVEEHELGPWEVEQGSFENFAQIRGPASFEIWMPSGERIARFPEAAAELPRPLPGAAPAYVDLALEGGRPARLYQAWLYPRHDEGGRSTGRMLAVSVTRDTGQLLKAIATFRAVLWGFTLAVIALAAFGGVFAVRRALRRITRLSDEIAALDASSLGTRLELQGVPRELRAPFEKLNDLLDRLEASFTRQRQFAADASHELRTPISGLRAVLEVAASRERPGWQYRASIGEALGVVRHMEALVEDLLELARTRASDAPPRREQVALRELAESCFAPYAETALERNVRFENRLPPGACVPTDADKLRIVLSNLLSNAAEYTAEGGWIAVESEPAAGLVVAVRDSGPVIPEEALQRIFDPFVRLDESRTGAGKHCGIGLALAQALCEKLGYRVEARNDPSGEVVFAVSAPAAELASPVAAA